MSEVLGCEAFSSSFLRLYGQCVCLFVRFFVFVVVVVVVVLMCFFSVPFLLAILCLFSALDPEQVGHILGEP